MTQTATKLPDTTTAPSPARPGLSRHQANHRWGYGMLAPFVVLFVLFLIIPAAYGITLSFFDAGLASPGLGEFLGLANYAEILRTEMFWGSVLNTIWFTVLTVPPLVIVALAIAIMANRMARGRWFLRLAFFAPYVLPSSVVALIWIWVFAPELGILTDYLGRIGITAPVWLNDPVWAMPSVAIAMVWSTLGFSFVLYLAGLQEIPLDLYESAALDGASTWQQITQITIPLLARTTTLVTMLQLIASLKIFDHIFLMTEGGPSFATRPIMQFIYDYGFTNYRVGFASAASMILFLIVLIISAVWFTIGRRRGEQA